MQKCTQKRGWGSAPRLFDVVATLLAQVCMVEAFLRGDYGFCQQTLVLLLSNCCCPFQYVVASRILRSLESDG